MNSNSKFSRLVVKNSAAERLRLVCVWCLWLLCISPFARADVSVSLAEPNWQFLLRSDPVSPTSAQLEPNERVFAQQIQPLLNDQAYELVAKAFSQRPLNADSAALQQLRGQVLLSLKNYPQAELALLAALAKMPNLALAHRSLSMVYMLQKNYDKARYHLTQSIALGVADAQIYGQLAFVNLNNHHAASAIAGYQQALFLEPDNAQWQQGLLYAWINSHNLEAAQRLVEDLLEQNEPDKAVELWLLRSQIALQRHETKLALSSLEVALLLAPQNTENMLLAAKLHVQEGSVSRAVELLSASLQQSNSNQNEALWHALEQIVPWLLSRGDAQHVEALLKSAGGLTLKPEHRAKRDLYQGQVALQQTHFNQAVKHFSAAINNDPLLGEAILGLAQSYVKQNKLQQAQMYFVRASALTSVKQQALLGNAQLQIDQGQHGEALLLLQQVLKLDPSRRDIEQNIRLLQKLVRQGQYAS